MEYNIYDNETSAAVHCDSIDVGSERVGAGERTVEENVRHCGVVA